REYRKVLTLPVAMRNSKMLLKLLRLMLQGDPPASPIQKIVLTGDAASPRVEQSGLFAPKGPDPEKLELTAARLAQLVGDGNVGAPELIDTHRFENFRMTRFVSDAEPTKRQRKTALLPPNNEKWQAHVEKPVGFRVIRPAVPVKVEMQGEQPAR